MPITPSSSRRLHSTSPHVRMTTTLAACALALASLAACSSSSQPSATSGTDSSHGLSTTSPNAFDSVAVDPKAAALLPARVKSSNSLSVAMNLSTPPTKFIGADGKSPLGTNADLARLLGRILGVKVDIRDVEFDGIIPGLQSGQFDLAIASIGVTADRTKVLDLVEYAQWGTSAVALKGKHIDINSLCGLRVGAQQGSLQQAEVLPKLSQACKSAGTPAIKIVSLPSQQDAVTQLISGRLDAAVGDTPNMTYAAVKQPGRLALAGKEVNPLPITFGTKKGSDLTPALVAAMRHALTLPAYREIFQTWGLPHAAVTTVKVY